MRLGRIGVWQGGSGRPAVDDREMVAELERLGYSAFWFGEAPGGKEAFTRATTLLAATSTIVVGTGIASIWGRDPLNTASAIRTVGEAFPGRFIAGLGVSHRPLVELRGEKYERPLAAMTAHLAGMAASAVVQRSPEPTQPVPVVLAALRPKMLELAASAADGAHPYFVPVEHTVRARQILGPDKLLAPEVAVVLEPDPTEARRLARIHTGSFYLSAPNYVENLRWLGWSDEDLAGSGSDALVDALVAWGDEEKIVSRLRDHLDAGADHVCIQPVTEIRPMVDGPDTGAITILRRLADALRDL
ncbi:MAG TPA: TIGR03620 family F420-dependent LLM class oxidoreductase [Ilumatobacteraceae bacterium]|nr:TIGR03620 family F420-dependent LLM class oxidoreductase [Ilumatobacteraceae bacterium]